MKPRLVPLYFSGRDAEFDEQLGRLRVMLADDAEILPELPLGAPLPACEAVLFPQILGEAYRSMEAFHRITAPILTITSEFGTVSMWDWEIAAYLRAEGLTVVTPYSLEMTQQACRVLGVRRELAEAVYLVYQDNPGEGFQPSIFKRFYWWEDECTQRMLQKFGVRIERKSFREMGARARALPDDLALETWKQWQWNIEGISPHQVASAVKIYLTVRDELDANPNIRGVGMNCLNESHFSDTTPCLAWSMLYEERGNIWGCEGDTMTILTKHLLHKALRTPIMMTNLYPFLMGHAALKHERIPHFPQVADPENHILAAHCGYFGVVPPSMASQWTLRPKVLAIVDPNSAVIDARLPEGPITLAKLHPTMNKLTVVEGEIAFYAQYANSDCLNGAVLRVPDGHRLVSTLASHHALILTGHQRAAIEMIGQVFGIEIEAM